MAQDFMGFIEISSFVCKSHINPLGPLRVRLSMTAGHKRVECNENEKRKQYQNTPIHLHLYQLAID